MLKRFMPNQVKTYLSLFYDTFNTHPAFMQYMGKDIGRSQFVEGLGSKVSRVMTWGACHYMTLSNGAIGAAALQINYPWYDNKFSNSVKDMLYPDHVSWANDIQQFLSAVNAPCILLASMCGCPIYYGTFIKELIGEMHQKAPGTVIIAFPMDDYQIDAYRAAGFKIYHKSIPIARSLGTGIWM